MDILGYLKNTHKNPKFGRVRQVPIRELGREFPGWDLSEGVNGVNRLATNGKRHYRLPTKREKYYRLPTGKLLTDYRLGPTLSIFFQKEEYIVFFRPF